MSTQPIVPRSKHRKLWIVLLLLVLFGLPLLGAVGVASYFRLSSDTRALRRNVMTSVPGQWDTKVAVRIGWLTTGLVRECSQLVQLPPEPRAALDALRGVEVAVYELQQQPRKADYAAVLALADKTMTSRGWDRVVGVVEANQCVAIFVPQKKFSAQNSACRVLVLSERDLVIVSAHGDLTPLLDLASKHVADTTSLALREWRE